MPYQARKDRKYLVYGRIYDLNDRPSAFDRWCDAKADQFLRWFFPTPRKDGTRSKWFSRHID